MSWIVKLTARNTGLLIVLLMLVGCTPTRVTDQIELDIPRKWQNQPAFATKNDLKDWWKQYHDPILNGLIAEALENNQDIKIAKSRINEVKALAVAVESALYPSLDIGVNGGREKKIDRIIGVPGNRGIELITPTGSSISGGLTARWEIDLFGGRQLDAEAALAQALGAEEALRTVQVGLLSEVATTYLQLRGTQKRLRLQQAIIEVNREMLKVLTAFFNAGLINHSDVASQSALLSASETALPVLSQNRLNLSHRLDVLLGKSPGSLASRLNEPDEQPLATPQIPRLLPGDLLTARPDLGMAKAEVMSQAAKLGSAKADMLPKIQLSASAGFGAIAVGGFPGLAETVYTLGSGLTAPIFNAGRIQAQISAADSRLQQAAAEYEKKFLLALEDVENAFVAMQTFDTLLNQFIEAEITAIVAFEQKTLLFDNGRETHIAVLDSQKNKLNLAEEIIKAETGKLVSFVSIYRAFGGGLQGNIVN